MSGGFYALMITFAADLKHTERPEGFYWDLHFNLRVSLYSICSYLPTTPGVGGGGGVLHFELQRSFFPDCVQTCLPALSFFPTNPLLSLLLHLHHHSTSPSSLLKHRLNHLWLYILAPTIIPFQSRGKSNTGRQDVFWCIYRIEGSCWYVTAHDSFKFYCNYANATAGMSKSSLLFCPGPTILPLRTMFTAF